MTVALFIAHVIIKKTKVTGNAFYVPPRAPRPHSRPKKNRPCPRKYGTGAPVADDKELVPGRRLSFAVDFNQRIDKSPALPDSYVGFNPFQIPIGGYLLKGLKPTEEEALPLIFKTVR